jgi:MuDR family transposase
VSRLYSEDEKLSLFFVDKRAMCQSFIRIEDDNSYRLMLSMYEEEKKMLIYVTTEKITVLDDGKGMDAIIKANIDFEGNEDWLDVEDDYDSCHSDDSYCSDSGSEDDMDVEYAREFYLYDKNNPKMDIGTQYPHVVAFRRALNHYAVINDFEFVLGKSESSRVTTTCVSRECN